MILPPLLLLACVSTPQGDDSGPGRRPQRPDLDPPYLDGGSGLDDSGGWEEPGDADGDGFTVEDGDCADQDETIHPGAAETACDGRDNDCDEDVDEDWAADPFEPNDEAGPDVADLATEGEVILVAWAWPEGDEDRYRFYVEDGDWDWFDVELWLYDVPAEMDYALELVLVEDADGDYGGVVDGADDLGPGGEELVNYGGGYGSDDSGLYEAVVRPLDGASCATPYTLQILVGSW